MRILLITDNHTPSGGAENYFFDLKERLKNVPGLEVYSLGFGPTQNTGKDFYVLKGLKSKIAKLLWQILFHPGVYFKLRKQIKKIRPDIIHIHNIKQYTTSLIWAIKPYPVVQTIHDYTVICPTGLNLHRDHQPCATGMRTRCFWQHQIKYNPFVYLALTFSFLKLRNQLKKTVRHFFAPSPLLVDYLKKNNFNEATYIAPFKKENFHYSLDTIQPFHFLFAGHLGMHKGVHMLIEEFGLACRENNNLVLTIAGTGPEENVLRRKIQEWGIEKNVRFVGWQHNLKPFYEKCMAVLFTSIGLEAFGLVMIEGMNSARPIIGANRGTSAWVIEENKTGLLFDPLKKGDLADKILTLAADIQLAKTLGINGYSKLQKFIDNNYTLEQIIAVYKKIIFEPYMFG